MCCGLKIIYTFVHANKMIEAIRKSLILNYTLLAILLSLTWCDLLLV